MHELFFYAAVAWAAVLLGTMIVLLLRSRSVSARIVALDTLTLILTALLVLLARSAGSAFYLDAALVLALVSFFGTVVAARYHGERRVFS